MAKLSANGVELWRAHKRVEPGAGEESGRTTWYSARSNGRLLGKSTYRYFDGGARSTGWLRANRNIYSVAGLMTYAGTLQRQGWSVVINTHNVEAALSA